MENKEQASLQKIDDKGKETEKRILREGENVVGIIESKKQNTLEILYEKYKVIKEDTNQYNQEVKEFRQKLIQHYNIKLKSMPLSRLNHSNDSTTLEEMYATPILYRTDKNKWRSHGQYEQEGRTIIHSYKDMFGATCKNGVRIFVQGEAGSGKTTFVAKLVLDWCKGFQSTIKTNEAETDLEDLETLQMFPFVFLVTLRDSIGEREIPKMIKQQVTDIIYSDFKREKAYALVQQIMEKEICLVVQDGLDEWNDVQIKLGQPLMLSSHTSCFVLTTTRPWKMADESIKDSDVGDLIMLEGVQDPYKLCAKVIGKYKDGDITSHLCDFESYLRSSNVNNDMMLKPMLLNLFVLAWIEDNPLKGSSCEIYSVLLDTLLIKTGKVGTGKQDNGYQWPPVKCFARTRYLKPNIEIINTLSLLAFRQLFSLVKEFRIVFVDKDMKKYKISKDIKIFALRCGILVERKCPTLTYASSTFSFVHKSVQEFLAAYFIACSQHAIDVFIPWLIEKGHYNIDDMFNIFKFLCGLNIEAANKLSCLLDGLEGTWYLMKFQKTLMDGCREALANDVDETKIKLKLSSIKYWHQFYYVDYIPFNCVVNENLSSIRSLTIIDSCLKSGELYLHSQYIKDVLISSAHCLENLQLTFTVDCAAIRHIDWYKNSANFRITDNFKTLKTIRIYCIIFSLSKLLFPDDATIEMPSDIEMIFPGSNSHATGIKDIIVPCTIEEITLQNVTISSTWLRHLLMKLASFDHAVTCRLRGCTITTSSAFSDKACNDNHTSDGDSCESNSIQRDRNNLTFVCSPDCEGLYEALTGLKIKNLKLFRISRYDLFANILHTIAELESLKIAFFTFINDSEPLDFNFNACNKKTIEFIALSPVELRNLLGKFSECDHPLEFRLHCGVDEDRLREYDDIMRDLHLLQFPGVTLNSCSLCEECFCCEYDDYGDCDNSIHDSQFKFHNAFYIRIELQCKGN
ncbi:uncharacterized protein LOC127869389 isoform X1 [Dreissena polymorpha]|nr:uncharacterized protein LOC127869389 isoform X1 [Dreissena polymorpha]